MEIKEELVTVGLIQELGSVSELLDFIELNLDQVVNGLHITLEGVSTRGDGAVLLAFDAFSSKGISTCLF